MKRSRGLRGLGCQTYMLSDRALLLSHVTHYNVTTKITIKCLLKIKALREKGKGHEALECGFLNIFVL